MLDSQGFDLWADGYDQSVQQSNESNVYPFAGYKDVLNTVYKAVRKKKGTILDIGFGTGVLTQKLYMDDYKITGIDFSERMIQIAQEKMPDANLIAYDFTKGLPKTLKDSNFDWIISTYAIHHLTDDQKKTFIDGLLEHLSSDGLIILGDVAFQTREALEHVSEQEKFRWDDEEFYLVADELKEMFPSLNVSFQKIAYCSGVISISR